MFQTLQLKSFYFQFWWPCRRWHWHWKRHVNHISWDIFAIFRWWSCPIQVNKKVEHSDDPATKRLIRLMEAQCHYQASQPTPEQWQIIFLYLLKNFQKSPLCLFPFFIANFTRRIRLQTSLSNTSLLLLFASEEDALRILTSNFSLFSSSVWSPQATTL